MLNGRYAEDAKSSYKTIEGKEFLAAVREAIRLIDDEMAKPPSTERGKMMGRITSALELAADRYDLFGEKDRRRKRHETETDNQPA